MDKSLINDDTSLLQPIAFVKGWLVTGAVLCLLSVLIGAFAAHGLKAVLTDYALGIVQTGAKYQMYHGLSILICSFIFMLGGNTVTLFKKANMAFLIGTILFSGSLYMFAATQIKMLVFLTPLGGLGFIVGWCIFIWAILQSTTIKQASNNKSKH